MFKLELAKRYTGHTTIVFDGRLSGIYLIKSEGITDEHI